MYIFGLLGSMDDPSIVFFKWPSIVGYEVHESINIHYCPLRFVPREVPTI